MTRPILPLAASFARSGSSTTSSNRILTDPSNARSFHSSPTRLSSPLSHDPSTGPPPNATLSQRLKYLLKYYGWYALGVYLVLSVVDFGVAFAAINVVGAEQVSQFAAAAKAYVTQVIHSRPPDPGREEIDSASGHSSSGHEGLYAMIVLAYTVHKTLFLPVRVGLTAAVTPKLVGWLARRGWVGGKGTMKAAREMRDKMRERSRERD